MGARRIAAAKPAKQKIAEVKEPRISRRLMGRVMVLSLLAGLLGSGVWWLAQPDTLPIEQVRVEGEFRFLKRSDLDMAVGDLASGGFFNVDVRGVKAAVETLPWVDSAAVWRQWPNTLRIAINEQQPLAYWGEGQMLNRPGRAVAPGGGTLSVDRQYAGANRTAGE
jgi:cell division protein FtsQ